MGIGCPDLPGDSAGIQCRGCGSLRLATRFVVVVRSSAFRHSQRVTPGATKNVIFRNIMKNNFKKTALPSLLSLRLKRLLIAALALAAFMLANTTYLLLNRLADVLGWRFFAANDISLPSLFQAMVLTHTGAGLLLVTLMLIFAVAHLFKVWKRHHPSSIISGLSFVVVGLTLTVTGLFILTAAASRNNKWAWWAHVICAALIPLGYFAHRFSSFASPKRATLKRFVLAVASLVLILAVAHGFTHRDIVRTQEAQVALEKGLHQGPGAKYRDLEKFINQSPNQYSVISRTAAEILFPQYNEPPATSNQYLFPPALFRPEVRSSPRRRRPVRAAICRRASSRAGIWARPRS